MRGLIYLNTGGESVFESLNYGYIEDGRRFPKKVAKGRFLMHNRVKIEELNYYS